MFHLTALYIWGEHTAGSALLGSPKPHRNSPWPGMGLWESSVGSSVKPLSAFRHSWTFPAEPGEMGTTPAPPHADLATTVPACQNKKFSPWRHSFHSKYSQNGERESWRCHQETSPSFRAIWALCFLPFGWSWWWGSKRQSLPMQTQCLVMDLEPRTVRLKPVMGGQIFGCSKHLLRDCIRFIPAEGPCPGHMHLIERNWLPACFYTFAKVINQIILNWALFAWKHTTQQHREAWCLRSRAGSKDCSEISLESSISWTSVDLLWLFITRILGPKNLGSAASNQPQPRNSMRETLLLVPHLKNLFLSTAALSTRLWPGLLHSVTPQVWAKADLSLRVEWGVFCGDKCLWPREASSQPGGALLALTLLLQWTHPSELVPKGRGKHPHWK